MPQLDLFVPRYMNDTSFRDVQRNRTPVTPSTVASMSTDAPAQSPEVVNVNGLDLACLTSSSIGDTSRPLALCVHGFPDSAHTWRLLMPQLEQAGFRVVAPFLRGYAPSAVPANGDYQIAASSLDMIGLHDHFNGDSDAVIVGHDWGAPITYLAATHEPARWSKVVGLAVPPGAAFGASFLTSTDQLKKSWYMFFFQGGLADLVVPSNDLAFIDMLWADWSPGYDASADLALLKPSLRNPENLSAALGFCRAALGDGYKDPALGAVQAKAQEIPPQPLLYLHGSNDGGIGREVAELARSMVGDNVSIDIIDHTGHFLHLEDPANVNTRIVDFLT
jgi:pimeloyl-ACP methyl ester carboxylesterase